MDSIKFQMVGDLMDQPTKRFGNVPKAFETVSLNRLLWILVVLIAFSTGLLSAGETTFAARAEHAYQKAKAEYLAHRTNSVAAWHFAQACFDRAEFAANDAERANIGREGIAAVSAVIEREPDNAAAHYYLGMNLGQVARTRKIGALKIVSEMETEFERANHIDEKFDFAGPDRCLGLLYLDAPSWPVSIGSRNKARQHLLRAVQLAPDYPENRICLIEAYLKWSEQSNAVQQTIALKERWADAKKRFSGEEWESAWADWEKRMDSIDSQLIK